MFRHLVALMVAFTGARDVARHVPQLAFKPAEWNDGGRGQYRGGPGNKAHQRQALKKRNQARHRRACRG